MSRASCFIVPICWAPTSASPIMAAAIPLRKSSRRDPLTGKPVEVLWVKGSGGDVGTIKLDGFATLYMEKLQSLKSIYKGVEDEDRMVGFLPHCTFNLNSRAASIDTPLHGFVPFKHVDHMHPDAIIAIAASKNSRELTQEIFGEDIGWLPWRRPGFQLGLDLGAYVAAHPNAKGVVLESHGLFTWANEAKACYELTLDIINKAIVWFDQKDGGKIGFRRAGHPSRLSLRRTPCDCRKADAGNSRQDRLVGAQAWAFRRSACCA